MSKTDLDKTTKQLEERLKTLGAKVDEIEGDLRSPHNADWEEDATESAGDEVLDALENSALAEITQIRNAPERIGDGTYSECETCGQKIAENRLAALPYATQCIECAEHG